MDGRDRGQNSGSLGPGTAMRRGARGQWMEFISILIWRIVIWMCTYVEILPAVPLRLNVHFIVCILQLYVYSTSKKKWRMSHFSLESVFPIGSKIRPGFSENSLLLSSSKTKKEDEREGGPVVGEERKDGGKKGVNFNKTFISFQKVSSFSFPYLLFFWVL